MKKIILSLIVGLVGVFVVHSSAYTAIDGNVGAGVTLPDKVPVEWNYISPGTKMFVTETDLRAFSLEARINGSQSGMTVTCLDCIPGITDVLGTSDGRIDLEFNLQEYLKRMGDVKLPHRVRWTFKAEHPSARLSNYTNKGYLEIVGLDCVKEYGSDETLCKANNQCIWLVNKCHNKSDESICNRITNVGSCTTADHCTWSEEEKKCISIGDAAINEYLIEMYTAPGDEYQGPLKTVPCAWSGTCRSTDNLVQVFIQIGEMIFGLVAGIAFVFFIYGGFTMMLSFGNAEKVKKGQQMLVAAIVGLVIVFSAYMLIDFLLDALQVDDSFRGVNL